MADQQDSSTTRAVLHALPTAIIALDSTDTIILANAAASRLLGTSREHLEGGSLARFISPDVSISSNSTLVTFTLSQGPLSLSAISKELVVDDNVIRVILLRAPKARHDISVTKFVTGLSLSPANPFQYVCDALVSLSITRHACIRSTTDTKCDVLASTTDSHEVFTQSPTISRTISKDEVTEIELVIIPDSLHGLTSDDLSVVDMFVSLLQLGVDGQENASDASGSETALALALKAGEMGMCFFDTSNRDCYLSDRLATWCSIDPDKFAGTIEAWLETFTDDDRKRISELFSELEKHKKFKTVVQIHTLEQDLRLELFGRPLNENSSAEWVAIARPFRDEQEVEAAWQTRIAMEESARIEAETSLETFESALVGTLLPTTSDVSIIHSRQDAGTWHIVRPLDTRTCVYAVGAVTASNRSQAVIDATITATIADVLASQTLNVDEYVEMIRDHARARDIETTIAGVRVVNGKISSATHAGASVFISGRSFVGEQTIEATTALSLSTHSQATVESIDVAANGRPWRIMNTVIEVVPVIKSDENQTGETIKKYDFDLDLTNEVPNKSIGSIQNAFNEDSEFETDDESEEVSEIQPEYDLGNITGQGLDSSNSDGKDASSNISHIRSGSITPN